MMCIEEQKGIKKLTLSLRELSKPKDKDADVRSTRNEVNRTNILEAGCERAHWARLADAYLALYALSMRQRRQRLY